MYIVFSLLLISYHLLGYILIYYKYYSVVIVGWIRNNVKLILCANISTYIRV